MEKDAKKKINLYNIRYKNSMKPVDWRYYTKFYPEKTKAIQALRLDTGLKLKEAKEIVDEIFSKVERGEVERRTDNTKYSESAYEKYEQIRKEEQNRQREEDLKKAGAAVGKGVGCGCFTIFYIIFGTIFKFTGNYMKKRR